MYRFKNAVTWPNQLALLLEIHLTDKGDTNHYKKHYNDRDYGSTSAYFQAF